MKRILFGLCLVSLPFFVFPAKVVHKLHKCKGEFYTGFGFGIVNSSHKIYNTERVVLAADAGDYDFAGPADRLGHFSPTGNFLLGVNYMFKRFYLAGELSGDLSSNGEVEATAEYSQFAAGARESYEAEHKYTTGHFIFNVDMLPGIIVGESAVLFGRIGLGVAWLNIDSSADFLRAAGPVNSGVVSAKTSKTKTGLRLGFGLEKFLGDHKWSVAVSYTATLYRRIRLDNGSSNFESGNGTLTSNTKGDLLEQGATIEMVYHVM